MRTALMVLTVALSTLSSGRSACAAQNMQGARSGTIMQESIVDAKNPDPLAYTLDGYSRTLHWNDSCTMEYGGTYRVLGVIDQSSDLSGKQEVIIYTAPARQKQSGCPSGTIALVSPLWLRSNELDLQQQEMIRDLLRSH